MKGLFVRRHLVVGVLLFLLPSAAHTEDAPAPVPAMDGPDASDPVSREKLLTKQVAELRRSGKYVEATPLARELLALRERTLGPMDPRVAEASRGLALVLVPQGETSEALELLRRVVAIQEARPERDELELAKALDDLASVCFKSGAQLEARALFERVLALRERGLGAEDRLVARSRYQLGYLLSRLGEPAKARALLEQALPPLERGGGRDGERVAECLDALGHCCLAQGDLDAARSAFDRARSQYTNLFGPNHPHVGTVSNNLAVVLRGQGDFQAAKALLEDVLRGQTATLSPEDPRIATTSSNLANVLIDLGDFEGARVHNERALTIRQQALGPESAEVAESLNNLASSAMGLGDYRRASALLQQALSLYEGAGGPALPRVAMCLNNLGVLAGTLGSSAEEIAYHRRALTIRRETLRPDDPELCTSLLNLGRALTSRGNLEEARPLLAEAVSVTSAPRTSAASLAPVALKHSARLLLREGSRVEAARLLERARALLVETRGADHPEVASCLTSLADLKWLEGEFLAARGLVEEALRIRERVLGSHHPIVAESASHLSSVLGKLGDVEAAQTSCLRALALATAHAKNSFLALGLSQRLALQRSNRYMLDGWIRLTRQAGKDGYAEVLRHRGVVARMEAVERTLARRLGREDAAQLEELRRAQRVSARLASAALPASRARLAEWQTRYARAEADRERLGRALAERRAPLREALERVEPTVADVQAHLDARTVLVDMFRGQDGYVAWVLHRGRPPVRVELGAIRAVESACAAFQAALQGEGDDPGGAAALRAAGTALGAIVWTPIERALDPTIDRLVLCPDGALAALPYVALPGQRQGRYLLDEFRFAYVSHPADLLPAAQAPPTGTGILILGGIDYERAEARRTVAAMAEPPRRPFLPQGLAMEGSFTALGGTRTEAEALAGLWGTSGARVRLGANATEASVRDDAPGRRYVHLATHGVLREDPHRGLHVRPEAEGLLSTADDPTLARGHDPLLSTSLAMAGANRRDGADGEDGMLTALEASYLDLDGVDLVTLSACDTARGAVEPGEGILGLTFAFRAAGARRVLASLWKVEDEATRRLMEGVYRRMWRTENPLSPAEALREAALALRDSQDDEGRRPFAAVRHWAVFVVYGP